jgi:hypothetical protein
MTGPQQEDTKTRKKQMPVHPDEAGHPALTKIADQIDRHKLGEFESRHGSGRSINADGSEEHTYTACSVLENER